MNKDEHRTERKKSDPEKKEADKQTELPAYDDTVDFNNDDDTAIDQDEYFEK